MKKNLTEVVFILDRSGSMCGLEGDTIGGYNSTLKEQMRKSESENGKLIVSTVLFDNFSEVIHDRMPVERVKPLTERDYYVRGCTALLDAVGGAIGHIGNVHKYARAEDRPRKTLFVIITDGMENASVLYNYADVKHMIERQKKRYGWEFLFLGANIDAAKEGSKMGIEREFTVNYHCDSIGTRTNYCAINDAISHVRSCPSPLDARWKRSIDKDRENRKRENRK